ncbi:iojap-like protein [Mycobacterium tuberculosis]|nr:iojap-like protein [Mycobacterium tuberculosis]
MTANREAIDMARVAAGAAAAKLADDVVVIDVSGQLVITDCFVIASGSNERQVNAIVDEVEEKMRQAGYRPARREGAREGRGRCWITGTSWCTSSIRTTAISTPWTGCGVTARWCRLIYRRTQRVRNESAATGDAAAWTNGLQRR